MDEKKREANPGVVFFDGVCHLCNRCVDILLRMDRAGRLRFASLQGSTAQMLLTPDLRRDLDSIVFLKDGIAYRKSEAILMIVSELPFGKLTLFLRLAPLGLRDRIYDFIASRRYKWFGFSDKCRLPTAEDRERLLP